MVYFWERNTSPVEFVNTARILKVTICQRVANKNFKSFTFYGCQDLARFATELFRLVNDINIYPTNKKEFEERQLNIKRSLQLLTTLAAQFQDVDDMIHFSDEVKQECSNLMWQEERLLNGLLDSDKKRFSKLM